MRTNTYRLLLLPFLILSVLTHVLAQQTPPLPVLTLEQSINLALEKNRMLKQAREATNKAQARIVEAKAEGYPHISLSSSYIQRDSAYDKLPLAVGIDNSIPAKPSLIFDTEPMVLENSSSAGIRLNKVVDINGLQRATTRAANIGAQITDLELARARNELILLVKQSYYNALRARDLMAVADETVKNAQTRLSIAQALVKNGVNPKLDIYRAETSVATAQQTQIGARNTYELTKATLNNIIGRQVDTAFEVQVTDEPAISEGSFDALIKEAVIRRPEVIMAAKGFALVKQQEIIARRGQMPSLVLSVGSDYDLLHQFDKYLTSYASVAIQIPLFDGWETKGRIAQAKSDMESAKITEDNTREMIALEVRQTSLSLNNTREQVTAADKARQQATESLRVSRARYQAGVGDQLELSDAELAYTQAQENLVNARYAVLVSQASLAKALGRYTQ